MKKIKQHSLNQLKLAIFYAYQSAPRLLIIRLLLMVFQSLLPLIPLYLIKLLVDGLGETQPNLQYLIYVIIGFGVVKMLLTIINNYATYCTEIQGQEIANYMSKMVIDKAVALDYHHHENPEFNNSFHRARTEAITLPANILSQLTVFVQNSLTMLALVGFLMSMHWMMTVILLLSAIPVAWVKIHFSKEKWELFFKQTNLRRKSHYFNYLLTNGYPAKELQVFGFAHSLKKRFVGLIEDLLAQTKKLAFHSMRTITLVQIVDVLALVFALFLIMQTTLDKAITIGSMVMFYQGFIKAQGALANLFQSAISIYYKRLFFADFVDFMNIPERQKAIEKAYAQKQINQNDAKGLEVKQVHFSYPGSSKEVLKNINIRLPEKGLVAIIGQNGSGKSSLIKLICGLYEPTKGKVTLDGIQINNEVVQQHISVLFQDFIQYELDVKDNVSISDPAITPSIQAIEASLAKVNLQAVVKGLPKEMNTHLGKSLEVGTVLSGGQWQRIALARALYKAADIYILDEPTSFIDPHHEQILLKNIRQLANEKLVLLITHKLYNLKQVDHLIVMDNGRIVEQGSYEEVLANCSLFANMVAAQQIDFISKELKV